MKNDVIFPILLITTVPDIHLGKSIANKIVQEHLAACVNIIGPIVSIYSWKDKICDEQEYILFIKTDNKKQEMLFNRIKELHSYEVPELITIKINDIGEEYWEWLKNWLIKND